MAYVLPFLISALMGMGVGGGGLLIIYLTICLGIPQLTAQGTNLLLFVLEGLGSFVFHLRKRKIKAWHILSGVSFGGMGSLLSSFLLKDVSPRHAQVCLGLLLIISGFITIYNALIKRVIKKF